MTWIKNLLIVCIMSLATLKGADMIFGAVFADTAIKRLHLQQRSLAMREFNPGQSTTVIPTAYYMQDTDGLEPAEFRVVIDKDGFIATGAPRVEDPEHAVLFLGGSTTEGLYVEEKSRFPARVQTLLRNSVGESINVYNAGVSGNNTMHSLLQLIGKGIPTDLDVAVLMNNINDVSLLLRSGSYWNAPNTRRLVIGGEDAVTGPVSFKSRMRTALITLKDMLAPNLYAHLMPRLQARFGLDFTLSAGVDEFEAYRGTNAKISVEDITLQFENAVRSFVALCRIWQIEPVLMTQFNRITTADPVFVNARKKIRGYSDEEVIAIYARFNNIIRNVAQDEGVTLIDLARQIPQNREYIYDIVHLNERGSLLAADIIATRIAEILSRRN